MRSLHGPSFTPPCQGGTILIPRVAYGETEAPCPGSHSRKRQAWDCEPRPWPSPAATPAVQRGNRGPEGEAPGPPSGKWVLLVTTVTTLRGTMDCGRPDFQRDAGVAVTWRLRPLGLGALPPPEGRGAPPPHSHRGLPTPGGGGSPGPAGGRGKDLSGNSKRHPPNPSPPPPPATTCDE